MGKSVKFCHERLKTLFRPFDENTINYKYIRFRNDQNDTLDAMIKPPYQKKSSQFQDFTVKVHYCKLKPKSCDYDQLILIRRSHLFMFLDENLIKSMDKS